MTVQVGVGSRGGNVRDLDMARDLQAQVKDKRDWRDAIDEQIRRTLLETEYFHSDDLDVLGIPPEHVQLKGTRSAWFRNQGFMEKTGDERKVAHKAANGRKAPIHRITSLGREKLVGIGLSRRLCECGCGKSVLTDKARNLPGHYNRQDKSDYVSDSHISEIRTGKKWSDIPGEQSAAGVDSENREGSAAKSQDKPSGTLDRPDPFTSGGSTGARPAVDPGGAPDVTSHASGDAARPYEPLSLLPEPDPEAWAA